MAKRMDNELNASSMADIAFLLLVFFLVTTTMNPDTGITVKLPPWSEDDAEEVKLNKRNVFAVLVNANNELLVRGEPEDIGSLRERAKEFIANPTHRADLAEVPKIEIISLKNDRGTKYATYLAVYNELKAAYRELWDTESQRLYGVPYSEDLTTEQKKKIRSKYPFILSEAEPTAYGEEEK